MRFTAKDLENTFPTSDAARHFFEAIELPELKETKSHAKTLDGLVVVDDTWNGGRGLSAIWTLTFTYRGHQFQIDTNHHAGLSEFFVSDSECADEILVEVLQHFDKLSPLYVDADDGPRATNSPSVIYVFFGWIAAGLCVIFAIFVVVCLLTGDIAGALGGSLVTALLFWTARDWVQMRGRIST